LAEIGNVLGGRYRLIELLGQGGMATIYRARDNELDRDVAIKLLRPEYERDPEFGTRFRQEARAAGSLNHPNIVSVYDYGHDPAGTYIVMELIDGEDLASVVRRTGALPPRQAARLAYDVASALAAAHARGIVHRDIKPGNVLVSRDGRIKVTDFGIARAVADAQLTTPGLTLGSVHYFSPEQARGEPTTAASDVYSLGIVLYELLTGRRPWTGDSPAAIAMARLSGSTPSPASVRTGIPPALDAIVRRAMARDASQRYRSAAEMADALDSFLSDRAPATGQGVGAAGLAGAGAAGAASGAAVAGTAGADAGAGAGAAGVAAAGIAAGAHAGGVAGGSTTRATDAASPATIASGVARPNPGGVPYTPDAYAGGYEAPRRRYAEPPPRERYAEPVRGGRGYDNYDDDRGRTSPWVWISALLALAILAVVAFLVVRLMSGPGTAPVEQVTLPSFVGKTYDQARTQASQLGVTLEIASSDQNSTKPPNTILSQDPTPGSKVDKGSPVRVVVSAAKEQVQVPTLVNEKEADAVQLLLQAGLVRGKVTQAFDPTIPIGNVVSQNPQAGRTVAKGTPVDYVVSKGAEPTPTPSPTPAPTPTPPQQINVGDYRCVSLGEASNQIEADGFRVGNVSVDTETSAAHPEGYAPQQDSIVVAQAPPPGSKRRPNSRIDLAVRDPALPPAPACPGSGG
jgi:eukaryotic-like serine/threonine-protein kinase